MASIATLACFNSASLIQYKSSPTSFMFDKPNGSNPSSPAILPSNLTGFNKKGNDLLLSAIIDNEDDDGRAERIVNAATALNKDTTIIERNLKYHNKISLEINYYFIINIIS